jgi:hypothetical protein
VSCSRPLAGGELKGIDDEGPARKQVIECMAN